MIRVGGRMFDTKSLCLNLIERSDVATALSTSGQVDARYLAANGTYLSLIERIWDELDGQSLIGKGSAIDDAARERRLGLLDRHGFYDCEQAVIGTASGRRVAVEISAQRIWCSGLACDLEFFRPLGPLADPMEASDHDARPLPRACFRPELQANLQMLSGFDRTILMRRMLTAVAEGGLLVAKVAPNPSIIRFSEVLRNRLAPYLSAERGGAETKLDFSALDAATAERHLLDMAGDIWSLIHFAKDSDAARLLERLVAPYTRPPSLLVGKTGS
jgi:hypothetical protein